MKTKNEMKHATPSYLFLDDLRIPSEAYSYSFNPVFLDNEWEIVRNYDEFVEWISQNGLPDCVSFDHDLSDVESAQEKTGFDCANWLVAYCLDNQLQCPELYCHSMNPVGKTKILGLLEQFKLFQKSQ
jgi:hypothetical protein